MSLNERDNPKHSIGVNTNNNLYNSSNVVSNSDGSILERLEYIQTNNSTIEGKVDTIDTNVDTINTNVDTIDTNVDTIDTNVDTIVNDVKGSTLNVNTSNYLSVTVDLSDSTWNTVASHELFTVTGVVRMRLYAEVTETGDDTSTDTATIQLGTETATNGWIAATQVDDLTAGELWADATPTEKEFNYSSVMFDKVLNGVDVGYEIAGEAATAGTIVFHCWYEALNSTGAVVVGTGGSLV